jgi:hypothetical protein
VDRRSPIVFLCRAQERACMRPLYKATIMRNCLEQMDICGVLCRRGGSLRARAYGRQEVAVERRSRKSRGPTAVQAS